MLQQVLRVLLALGLQTRFAQHRTDGSIWLKENILAVIASLGFGPGCRGFRCLVWVIGFCLALRVFFGFHRLSAVLLYFAVFVLFVLLCLAGPYLLDSTPAFGGSRVDRLLDSTPAFGGSRVDRVCSILRQHLAGVGLIVPSLTGTGLGLDNL